MRLSNQGPNQAQQWDINRIRSDPLKTSWINFIAGIWLFDVPLLILLLRLLGGFCQPGAHSPATEDSEKRTPSPTSPSNSSA